MEIKQTPNCLSIKTTGAPWVMLNCSVGIFLIIISVSLLTFDNWMIRFWGICLLLSGGGTLLITLLTIPLQVTYTFDKILRVVRLEHKTVLYPKITEWRLNDIQSVQVDAEEDSDRMTHYVINLILVSGQVLQLREVTNNPDQQAYEPIVKRIRQFLNSSD